MAANVLSEEQRLKLVEWLAAGYPEPLIQQFFAARGWKSISQPGISWHREQHREHIDRCCASARLGPTMPGWRSSRSGCASS